MKKVIALVLTAGALTAIGVWMLRQLREMEELLALDDEWLN